MSAIFQQTGSAQRSTNMKLALYYRTFSREFGLFLPATNVALVILLVASICVFVCLSVVLGALNIWMLRLRNSFFVCRISRSRSSIKVMQLRSRSYECNWCHGYKWAKLILKLFQPLSMSDWNNFILARGNLTEIISKLFQRLIAAHEYFPTCSLSLK